MNRFDKGIPIYSIDEEQNELVVYLGKLRNFHNEYAKLKEENLGLKQANVELVSKNNKLQNYIYEAIEYIKNRIVEDDYILRTDAKMVQNELLKILRGGFDE